MGKSYNLGSTSDMRRFSKDLEKNIMNKARNAVHDMDFDVECPHCKQHFQAHSGMNFCPFCQKQVDVNLDIQF